ncbi:polysaccharide deacetylase family protein [Lewinella sp. 4G2]|uniref:polysaccharide deacetylase family protein n=1 Tax=Lewinella sp. 4G2 TaxID=1803372 RepID=UPI0007B49084|nr:polysaccharide deacetylase family protein [Lewinella sp. 4G2]OAV45005.1 hypothetical protein A3850_011125 [Lewinella sp. 4G2]
MPQPTIIPTLAAARHPRLRYVLKEVSRDLGYQFQLITDQDKWLAHESPFKLRYGLEERRDVACPAIPTSPILKGKGVSEVELAVEFRRDGYPTFFNSPAQPEGTSQLPFDALACIFFCLGRYEEYSPFQPDDHGRFPATQSHAAANDYLHLPVVRYWCRRIAELLQGAYPTLPPPKSHPNYFQPTYDIDLLWAYHHRGWKGLASGVRDSVTGKWDRARLRFSVSESEDSYNLLTRLLALHPRQRPNKRTLPYVFWLLANNDLRQDVNPYPIPDEQVEAIRTTSDVAQHGIHPGYGTLDNLELLREETQRLGQITGCAPRHGRQHFLRFRLPDTYRNLLLAGIANDHSMGYADQPGWRAGTNLPYKWYDLEREAATGLTIHPFAAMDVTLKNYENIGPAEARDQILELRAAVAKYGGPFTLLWHNSSYAPEHGWAGWGEMYEELVQGLHDLDE